jgi:hypothetical protein
MLYARDDFVGLMGQRKLLLYCRMSLCTLDKIRFPDQISYAFTTVRPRVREGTAVTSHIPENQLLPGAHLFWQGRDTSAFPTNGRLRDGWKSCGLVYHCTDWFTSAFRALSRSIDRGRSQKDHSLEREALLGLVCHRSMKTSTRKIPPRYTATCDCFSVAIATQAHCCLLEVGAGDCQSRRVGADNSILVRATNQTSLGPRARRL